MWCKILLLMSLWKNDKRSFTRSFEGFCGILETTSVLCEISMFVFSMSDPLVWSVFSPLSMVSMPGIARHGWKIWNNAFSDHVITCMSAWLSFCWYRYYEKIKWVFVNETIRIGLVGWKVCCCISMLFFTVNYCQNYLSWILLLSSFIQYDTGFTDNKCKCTLQL